MKYYGLPTTPRLVRRELVEWDRGERFRASPLALAVLSLLQAAPLHPYGIQRLLKLWGKDNVINVGQRANLYKTIRRLDQAGLIAVRQTERDQQYPERTVYELTDAGRQVTKEWLTDMLARPRNEYPRFPAALSFIMLLSPAEAAGCFRGVPRHCAASLPIWMLAWRTPHSCRASC